MEQAGRLCRYARKAIFEVEDIMTDGTPDPLPTLLFSLG